MTEYTFLSEFTTVEEIISFCIGVTFIVTSVTYMSMLFVSSVAATTIDTIRDIIKHIKQKKTKSDSLPSDYHVENRGDGGIVYRNNYEFLFSCNNYENALAIKEILENDEELPYNK